MNSWGELPHCMKSKYLKIWCVIEKFSVKSAKSKRILKSLLLYNNWSPKGLLSYEILVSFSLLKVTFDGLLDTFPPWIIDLLFYFYFRLYIKEEFKKKIHKSDIVHIWVWPQPTLPISDIKFSDIFFQSLNPPYPMY